MITAAVCAIIVTVFAVTASAGSKTEEEQGAVLTEYPTVSNDTADTPDFVQTVDSPQKKAVKEAVETKETPDKATEDYPKKEQSRGMNNSASSAVESKKDDAVKKESAASENSSSKKETDTSSRDENSSKAASSSKENTSSKEENTSSKGKESKKSSDTKAESKSEAKSKNESDSDDSKEKIEINPEVKNPPTSYHISVKHINQIKDMPTGCEIVSTKMVLDYYGKNCSYDDMLSHIKKDSLKVTKDGKLYGKTPFQAFIGDPKQNSGFGCYPSVITDMIDSYNFDDLYAESTCSLPLDFVAKTYLTQDIPVLVWATIGMGESYPTYSWYVSDEKGNPTKEKYTWRAAEHCLVLVGYDDKYYYFCDPMSYQDVTKYEKKLVEKRYKEVGSYSLLIRKYDD